MKRQYKAGHKGQQYSAIHCTAAFPTIKGYQQESDQSSQPLDPHQPGAAGSKM